MKVRMQSHPNTGFIQNTLSCFKEEGIRGFFKGMSLPFYTISLINAASLVGNEFAKKLIGNVEDKNLSVKNAYLCGYLSGYFTLVISTPVELVKCKLQIQTDSKVSAYYKGVLDCLRKIIKEDGLKGIYRGNIITLTRDSIGLGAQFGSYQWLKLKLMKYKKIEYENLSFFDILAAGCFSGGFSWLVTYHFDFIKTFLQTNQKVDYEETRLGDKNYMEKAKFYDSLYVKEMYCPKRETFIYFYKPRFFDGGMISCFMHTYYLRGIKGMFKGVVPCVVSTFYGYGIMFVIYEYVKSYLERKL